MGVEQKARGKIEQHKRKEKPAAGEKKSPPQAKRNGGSGGFPPGTKPLGATHHVNPTFQTLPYTTKESRVHHKTG